MRRTSLSAMNDGPPRAEVPTRIRAAFIAIAVVSCTWRADTPNTVSPWFFMYIIRGRPSWVAANSASRSRMTRASGTPGSAYGTSTGSGPHMTTSSGKSRPATASSNRREHVSMFTGVGCVCPTKTTPGCCRQTACIAVSVEGSIPESSSTFDSSSAVRTSSSVTSPASTRSRIRSKRIRRKLDSVASPSTEPLAASQNVSPSTRADVFPSPRIA